MNELDKKIEHSIEMLKRGERLALALNPDEGYFVGFSGGKDSQVLLDLVKRAGVKFKAVYSVTTIDPPENVYFIREHYPEVQFQFPKKNFFKQVETKGLPTIFHRFCCSTLKEGIGAGYMVLTGVRREESLKRSQYQEFEIRSRRKEHADRGRNRSLDEVIQNEHQCIKGKDKIMYYVLLDWTEKDVWQYIADNHLPVNPCYQNGGRVGCMFCPFASREQHEFYERKYPKFKENIIKSMEIYLSHRTEPDKAGFQTAEDYYSWWASKKKLNIFLKTFKK